MRLLANAALRVALLQRQCPAFGGQQAGQDQQQARFPRPVAAGQQHRAARLDAEGQSVEDGPAGALQERASAIRRIGFWRMWKGADLERCLQTRLAPGLRKPIPDRGTGFSALADELLSSV